MENFCGSKPPEGGCGSRQAQGFYPLWQPTASVFHGNRRFADCDPIAQFDRFDPRTTIGLPLEVRAVSRALDFLIPVSEALPQRGTRDSNPQPRVPTRSQNRKRPNAQSHRANGGHGESRASGGIIPIVENGRVLAGQVLRPETLHIENEKLEKLLTGVLEEFCQPTWYRPTAEANDLPVPLHDAVQNTMQEKRSTKEPAASRCGDGLADTMSVAEPPARRGSPRGSPWGFPWGPLLALACALVGLGPIGGLALTAQPPAPPTYVITRHLEGDVYTTAADQRCPGLCGSGSGGTSQEVPGAECSCQCLPRLPIFRDDLHVCVDDIHECSLVPFVSGASSQTVPFVFLPLKGQIIFPSAEIQFPGNSSPICVVSGARFLARAGWVDMRNHSDTEPPLRLLRDNGRSYLQVAFRTNDWAPPDRMTGQWEVEARQDDRGGEKQKEKFLRKSKRTWLGEPHLRRSMEGRLLLVQLMCKEEQSFFTPCVGLRVAGTPNSFSGVREVSFSPVSSTSGGGGGSSDAWSSGALGAGWLVGASGGLLGLAYVLAALVYMRARRRKNSKRRERQLAGAAARVEEGRGGRDGRDNGAYLATSSAESSCCSESDGETPASDSGMSHGERRGHGELAPHGLVSVVVHGSPGGLGLGREGLGHVGNMDHYLLQDSAGIERLPEEDVSIVETLDTERPDAVRAMAGPPRRKLYFNPAYFDPELLAAPPPAALEFLSKIREVISIAKHKMAAKRFAPSLVQIPEEDSLASTPEQARPKARVPSRAASMVRPSSPPAPPPAAASLRSAGSTPGCPGCPGCTAAQLPPPLHPAPNPPLPLGCTVCAGGPHSKQQHIRKWLEEVRAPRSGELDDSGSVKSEGSVYGPVTPLRTLDRPGGGSFRQPSAEQARQGAGGGVAASAGGRRKSAPRTPAKYMLENMRAARLEAIALEAEAGGNANPAHGKGAAPPPPKAAAEQAVKGLPPKVPTRKPAPAPVATSDHNNNGAALKHDDPAPSRGGGGGGGGAGSTRPREPETGGFRGRSASVTNRVHVSAEDSIVRRNAMHSPPPPPPTAASLAPAADPAPTASPAPGLVAQQKEAIARKLSASVAPAHQASSLRGKSAPSPPPPSLPPATAAPAADKPEVPKQLMDAVIKELVVQRGLETVAPKPPAPAPPKPAPPSFALPAPTDTANAPHLRQYHSLGADLGRGALPNFLTNSEGYSLVSEVYVNDNYSFSSSGSAESGGASPSPTHSSSGSSENNNGTEKNIKYSDKQPGHLTIQVDDSPDNKRLEPEADNFEPDTLDRKAITKVRAHRLGSNASESSMRSDLTSHDAYLDSLERPGQHLLLRTAGSFRSADPPSLPVQQQQHLPACSSHLGAAAASGPSPFNRMFGSLREIYESRARCRAADAAVIGPPGLCGQTQSLHGSLHGGSLHGGSLHGSLHGGSLHGGSQYSDTDCTSVASSSRRSTRSARSAHTNGSSSRPSKQRHRQRYPSPPRGTPKSSTGGKRRRSKGSSSSTGGVQEDRAPPPPRPPPLRPPKPKPPAAPPADTSLYQEPPPPRPIHERDPSPGMGPDRPPLPPRNPKPALPPKQAVQAAQAVQVGSTSSSSKRQQNPAHRPLPPLPPLPPRGPGLDRDREQDLDAMSAASADSLNSSDYEAFYSMPMSSPPPPLPCVKGQFILQANKGRPSLSAASSPAQRRKQRDRERDRDRDRDASDAGSEKAASYSGTTFLQETQLLSGARGRVGVGKDLVRHLRDKRGSDSVKKSWRKVVDRSSAHAHPLPILCPVLPHKPEDSGYLSTDSNESKRRLSIGLGGGGGGLSQGQSQGSLSDTDGDESLCDGASESGGESVATDSFFFGSFRGAPGPGGGASSDRRRSGGGAPGGGGGTSSRRSSVVLMPQ
ncbi:Matrix metalloproteinase-16 [Frankliniella fusca]|uniref:Matrix metalloproteinase-16 n=1 Tax=Frankliniella fusca TaxID=407009 RepID=A0AAE1HVD9_9NEOP|nr:Matrix metalloproteinase-16 [Frankliniella fusca]